MAKFGKDANDEAAKRFQPERPEQPPGEPSPPGEADWMHATGLHIHVLPKGDHIAVGFCDGEDLVAVMEMSLTGAATLVTQIKDAVLQIMGPKAPEDGQASE